jgi:MFS family permease
MTSTPTKAEKLRKLPWSVATDTTSTIYAQLTFFGSVFVLFLDELDFSKAQIGFLLSIITFSSLTALFVAAPIARYGYKRVFIIFWGLRKAATIFLLFTPWIIPFGPQATLFYVAGVILLFALARAIAITAYFPWVQEFVPNTVRGKYAAVDNIFAALAGLVAITGAGYLLERTTGLNGYLILFAIGVFFGAISTWTATHIPGGAPVTTARSEAPLRSLLEPVRDGDFLRYIFGASAISLATVPLASFLPLFMQEQVGLSSGSTVLLQTGSMSGGLLSTFFWGWAADRYGSKPVTLSGISLLILLPLCWLLMPRYHIASLYIALAIAFLQGVAGMGWGIGAGRLLFVSIVPADKKTGYMAVYYAALDGVNGLSQILGGQIVQWSAGITGQFLIFTLDPYIILFLMGLLLPLFSLRFLSQVRSDSSVTLAQFAGLFLHGNAFMALRSLIQYHFAKDESAAVSVTEYLGRAKSGLTVAELLASLADPRFNVRFETIVSIARARPDPRLTEALIKVFNGTELALTVNAAWALSRIGDPAAIEPLRAGLASPYRSIRAQSARALAALGDADSIPTFMERLRAEADPGLQIAYAAALGQLGAVEAAPELLRLLKATPIQGARLELALALARLVGHEDQFIHLFRQARADPGLATSQAVTTLIEKAFRHSLVARRSLITRRSSITHHALIARHSLMMRHSLMAHHPSIADHPLLARHLWMARRLPDREAIHTLLTDCADALANQELDRGAVLVAQAITLLLKAASADNGAGGIAPPKDGAPLKDGTSLKNGDPNHAMTGLEQDPWSLPLTILQECATCLDEFKASRLEYLLLALHTLNATELLL